MKQNIFKQPKIKSISKICIGGGAIALICAAAPTSGQYTTDVTQFQSNNIAQASVQQINMILCIIQNTNFSQFTNKGPQLAQVDQNMCQTSGNQGQQANGGSTVSAPNFMNIIFNTTRADANSPQIANFWISANIGSGNGSSNPMNINATLSVNQTPTTANPYGQFDFEYAGYPLGNISGIPQMIGYIRSQPLAANGVVQLSSYQSQQSQQPQQNNTSQVALVGAGTTSGYGLINMPNQGGPGGSSTLNLAMSYNTNGLLVAPQGSSNICYNRNNLSTQVYQYGVYNNAGGRLSTGNSGYPLMYQGMQGYLSYYGPSLPGNVTPNNGDSLTYTDQNGVPGNPGTFLVTGGKMSQYVPQTLTLAQMAGVPINVPNSTPGSGGANTNAIISWNSTSQTFNQIGTQTCGPSGCSTTNQSPTPYGQSQFASTVMASGNGTGTVNLWINGVGSAGNTQLALFSGCTFSGGISPTCSTYTAPTNATNMLVWNNSLMAPSAGIATTYYCIQNCPYQSNGQWNFANPAFDPTIQPGSPRYITYSFNPSTYVLTGTSGVANNTVITSNSQSQMLMTGPLLTLAQYNQISNNGTNPPDMSQLFNGTIQSYLQWQSGGLFNSYIGIQDVNGNLLPLSAPLQLTYVNASGSTNFLQYLGFGNLQGIPGTCLDQNGNAVMNCAGGNTTWVPAYNIPSGSSVTDSSGNTYWVKQLFVAQSMQTDSSGVACNGLDLSSANALTLPTVNSWVNPTPIVGPAPNVTKVSVINGINQ